MNTRVARSFMNSSFVRSLRLRVDVRAAPGAVVISRPFEAEMNRTPQVIESLAQDQNGLDERAAAARDQQRDESPLTLTNGATDFGDASFGTPLEAPREAAPPPVVRFRGSSRDEERANVRDIFPDQGLARLPTQPYEEELSPTPPDISDETSRDATFDVTSDHGEPEYAGLRTGLTPNRSGVRRMQEFLQWTQPVERADFTAEASAPMDSDGLAPAPRSYGQETIAELGREGESAVQLNRNVARDERRKSKELEIRKSQESAEQVLDHSQSGSSPKLGLFGWVNFWVGLVFLWFWWVVVLATRRW